MEHLSSEAGIELLRALRVKGDEVELRSASDEFSGHCLALTLLGSYLADAHNGDIRCRNEVAGRLGHDIRQGVHARKVMESYQNWFGEGPELSVLRMLGLFDRPAGEKALGALLKRPVIPGLTESLAALSQSEWRTVLGRLRRARLLAGEDPRSPWDLDTHPLVREYFGEQLRSRRTEAWKECNRRLFDYYRALAPQLPESFSEMEPLFLAVICGCNAGLFREALHEVYIPRIQRGNDMFAANILGARGPLLSVLSHFFENGHWGSPVEPAVKEQSLTEEDQLFILMQAAQYLTATRGMGAKEPRICYERAESLCRSLNRPRLLSVALIGQWRYSLLTDELTATMKIAKRMYSLAQEQNDSTLMIGACSTVGATHYYLGDFEIARQYITRALRIWRSGGERFSFQEVDAQSVGCLSREALLQWHFGAVGSCNATMAKAISLAKDLNHMHGLAVAGLHAGILACLEHNPEKVERLASELIELSTRQNFALWLAGGTVLRGWARSVSGSSAQGLSWMEDGLADLQAIGAILFVPFYLGLKAEALHLADRTSEALEAIREAEALVERTGGRYMSSELHRLRGAFLVAMGADDRQVEASFRAAIGTARQQKSVSLEKRAEATYAEYLPPKSERVRREGIATISILNALPAAPGVSHAQPTACLLAWLFFLVRNFACADKLWRADSNLANIEALARGQQFPISRLERTPSPYIALASRLVLWL